MTNKILRSFTREADGALVNTTDRIVSKMKGNSNFPNPKGYSHASSGSGN